MRTNINTTLRILGVFFTPLYDTTLLSDLWKNKKFDYEQDVLHQILFFHEFTIQFFVWASLTSFSGVLTLWVSTSNNKSFEDYTLGVVSDNY